MSAVAGATDELAALASRLAVQAADHDSLGRALRRSLDLVPPGAPASLAMAFVVTEADRAGRGMAELVRSIDDLAGFVWDVADALVAADATLGRIGTSGGSGSSPWTTLGSPNGSGTTRRYARGVRHVSEATFAGPMRRSDRTRSVTTGRGSVRDGWNTADADVSVLDVSRTAQTGKGATSRFGSDRAHVDVATFAGAVGTVGASVGVGDKEARLAARAAVEAGLSATAAAFAGSGLLGVGAAARVFTGARIEGEARVLVGLRGVDAQFTAHALLGGSADAEAEVDLLGVRTTGHAGVSYGLGAELEADASIGLDKISLKLDLGATIGLGISLGVDVSISPRAVAGGVAGACGDGAGAAKAGVKKLKGLFS